MKGRHGRSFSKKIWRSLLAISRRTFTTSFLMERSKPQLLEFLSKAHLKEYELTNFRVTMLNPDAAIVTYNVNARAVIQGTEISMYNAVTSGWARRDGRWLNVSAVASTRS